MRITTRIALGMALLAGVTLTALAYQVRTVSHLQGINEELTRTNLEAARISIRLVQDFEGVREFASKALVTEDAGYMEGWTLWEEAVQDDLSRLLALELGAPERQAVREIERGWLRYLVELAPIRREELAWPRGEELGPVLDRIDALVGDLRGGAEEVLEQNQRAVADRGRVSALAAERAVRISWIAALGALGIGVVIFLALHLSISRSLRRLTRGTRELAEGRFDHRLPTAGSDELAELARDFNLMAARLDELEDMKRDFISHVSHELKGPLAAIHETILVLLDEIPGPLTEKQNRLLTLSRQSATRLSAMISNLLEISRIESGALALDAVEFDPTAIVREVVEELSPLVEERRIRIEVNPPGAFPPGRAFRADPDRLREVIANLVGNALKFSPKEGRVRIGMRAVEEGPAPTFCLEVEDEGPGIPEEHREGVFEKFYQVKRGVRIHGQGVGLGLSICRRITEAHGGRIRAEEGSLGGARFVVELPLAATSAGTFEAEASTTSQWSKDEIPEPGARRPAEQPR